MESLEGHLLFASPKLLDNNFVHTVVLLVQHNDQGALGLVLNRPTSKRVRELWKEVGKSPCESELPVHLGGPVAGPLMAIHTNRELAEVEIVSGVYFAARKKNLDAVVLQTDGALKVFIGHAGWAPGQLESEIEEGAWRAVPATAEYIFYQGDDLWAEGEKLLNRSMLVSVLKIKHVPDDPALN